MKMPQMPRFLFGFSLCFAETWGFVGNPWTYMALRDLNVKEARRNPALLILWTDSPMMFWVAWIFLHRTSSRFWSRLWAWFKWDEIRRPVEANTLGPKFAQTTHFGTLTTHGHPALCVGPNRWTYFSLPSSCTYFLVFDILINKKSRDYLWWWCMVVMLMMFMIETSSNNHWNVHNISRTCTGMATMVTYGDLDEAN